ncbi:TECT1 protein, partial [Polypterus senegalus]
MTCILIRLCTITNTDLFKMMHTEVCLNPEEFDYFHVEVDTEITFCLKELRSTNRFGQLTVMKSSSVQDCLALPGERLPVLFGMNMASGCSLRINNISNCSLVSEQIFRVLIGSNVPVYVASFGNSQAQNVLDWVQINTVTTASWTKYGSLVNPQAQIVSVTRMITTNSTALQGTLQISSTVSFVDVSAAAQPGYKAPPTIDAKLPFDFFFPFV